MKIAVLNYSGNVGKTTIARDVLHRNLPDYTLVSVESVNADGKEETVIRGEDGEQIYTEILVNENMILDIGSSNLENFFKNAEKEREILQSIDLFIVPVTPEKKQQTDAIKTIRDILIYDEGNHKNIKTVLNQCTNEDFSWFKDKVKGLGVSLSSFDNKIFKHDLYATGENLSSLIDDTDYRSLLEQAKEEGEQNKSRAFAKRYIHQKKVKALCQCYDAIFENLMEPNDE